MVLARHLVRSSNGGHSMSVVTYPIILSTAGLPVVPDTSLSQLVSVFEFTTFVPVMSESSQGRSIFPVPVTRNNPWHALYNKQVLTHPEGEFNHLFLRNGLVVTPQLFPMLEYLKRYPTCSTLEDLAGYGPMRKRCKGRTVLVSVVTHL